MLLTCTPNPALDRAAELPRLTVGGLNRLGAVKVTAGGKGINVARIASSMGVPSQAILPVGGPNGSRLRELLEAEGLDCVFLPVEGETRANLKLRSAGIITEFNEAGPPADAGLLAAFGEALKARVQPGDFVVFCGSLPPGFPADGYQKLLVLAKHLGAFTVLDTSGEALKLGLGAKPDLIKPNGLELGSLFGEPEADMPRLLVLARQLLEEGMAGAVLCSLGADGAFYLTREGYRSLPALPVSDPVTTVGAGDALLAGFLAGRLRGEDPEAAMQTGLLAAHSLVSGEA